jgi:GTP cyclohydrolase FolE2
MLVLIGIFGFFAQVCHPVYLFLRPVSDRLFQPTKILLTMGLQRETAGRGALAIYTSVCPPCSHHLMNAKVTLRQIVFAVVFEFAFFIPHLQHSRSSGR